MVGLTTSRGIWNSLESSFARQSKAKIMQYKMQLQFVNKENMSMIDYLGKMKTYCDLLAAVGCKISEDNQILHVLNGLNAEYDLVIVAISARVDGWAMQNVSSLLLSFESRLEVSKPSKVNMERSALSLLILLMLLCRTEKELNIKIIEAISSNLMLEEEVVLEVVVDLSAV